jgi:hypothetical protein
MRLQEGLAESCVVLLNQQEPIASNQFQNQPDRETAIIVQDLTSSGFNKFRIQQVQDSTSSGFEDRIHKLPCISNQYSN